MRKKESIYKNWDEVNSAMKELAELNISLKSIENNLNKRIDEIKKELTPQADTVEKSIKVIEKEIELFAEQNRADFTKKRTKKLRFGKISFRYSKSVWCGNTSAAIAALKSFAMEKYLRVTEALNRDMLINADPKLLAKCGILVKTSDKVSIDPDYAKLASIEFKET